MLISFNRAFIECVFFFFYRSPVSTIQILMPFLWPSTKVTVDKKRALNCCSRVTSTNPFQLRRGQCWLFTIYTESCESVRKCTFFSSELINHIQISCEGEKHEMCKNKSLLFGYFWPGGSCVALTGSLAKKKRKFVSLRQNLIAEKKK